MALAHFLKCPVSPGGVPMLPVTLILQDRSVITKRGSDSRVQKFPSRKKAEEHLERVLFLQLREGCQLVETREMEDEPAPKELGGDDPGTGVRAVFDPSRGRMTLTFAGEPPATVSEKSWLTRLSKQTMAQVRARMEQDQPRCVHVLCEWATPGALLAKMLHPGLEALIFDTPYDTVERQSWNSAGDIAGILKAAPNLQRAFFTGCSTMSKTSHGQLRELYLIGNPLKPAVLDALKGSEFPALETLAVDPGPADEAVCARLVKALRSIRAPRLAQVYVNAVPMVEFLSVIGAAPLSWRLCCCAPAEDDIEGLVETLDGRPALRECGLTLDLDDIPFESEISRLQEKGVTFEDMDWRFRPKTYEHW